MISISKYQVYNDEMLKKKITVKIILHTFLYSFIQHDTATKLSHCQVSAQKALSINKYTSSQGFIRNIRSISDTESFPTVKSQQ